MYIITTKYHMLKKSNDIPLDFTDRDRSLISVSLQLENIAKTKRWRCGRCVSGGDLFS